MKISVSMPEEDVDYLDSYARDRQLDSRSAVLHKAIRLLRASELGAAYEDAWTEWDESEDSELWDAAAADGVG